MSTKFEFHLEPTPSQMKKLMPAFKRAHELAKQGEMGIVFSQVIGPYDIDYGTHAGEIYLKGDFIEPKFAQQIQMILQRRKAEQQQTNPQPAGEQP